MRDDGRRPVQPEDLLTLKAVADVQLSAAGDIAYVLTEIDMASDAYRSNVWLVPAGDATRPVQFTRGPGRDSAPRWSPDGRSLAFLSDRDDDVPRLYVMPVAGGEARCLTALEDGAGPAVWSPDGASLLFSASVPVNQPPENAGERARWRRRPRVVTRAHYKSDGFGYTLGSRAHLFVVPAGGGEPRQITHGDCNERVPAWSADGQSIAFSRTRDDIVESDVTDIWVMDAAGGNERRLTTLEYMAGSPSFSPDGGAVAFYAAGAPFVPHVDVWTVAVAGGGAHRVTAKLAGGAVQLPAPASSPAPVWSAGGDTLTFLAASRGSVHLVRARVADGDIQSVVTGDRVILAASVAPAAAPSDGGRIAFAASTPDNPGDIHLCDWNGANERRLTAVNAAVLSGLALPRVERRVFAGPHGVAVEGWLTYPMGCDVPAPLVVDIHGGPHGFTGNGFPWLHRYALAGRGRAVLALNPTGSTSYGREFALGLRGRWGELDLPEQLAAVDALIAEGIADPDRLAVTGYSYGGYMTAWAITHTDRFKAAVVGAPLTDLESATRTSDISMKYLPWCLGVDTREDRENPRRLSPAGYVERVTTPTLILQGEADDRCPPGQAEQLYTGLVMAGRAPAEFVRYPGSSHSFPLTGRPSHRVDFARRIVDWVARWVY